MKKFEVGNGKTVAIYARVSTTEQADEGYSIDEQIRVLNEYCSEKGYFVFDEYIDRGISGKNISGRPAVQRLLKDAEEKKFDAYTEELIPKSMYVEKASALDKQIAELNERMKPLNRQMQGNSSETIAPEAIKQILKDFSKAFEQALTREQRKRLLHLIINKITINEDRKIDSIQLVLNEEVLNELKLEVDDLSPDELSTSFSVLIAI